MQRTRVMDKCVLRLSGAPGRGAYRDRLRTCGLHPPAPRSRRGVSGAGAIHVSEALPQPGDAADRLARTSKLETDGEYAVRVYLMRSAARRNETADFTLN